MKVREAAGVAAGACLGMIATLPLTSLMQAPNVWVVLLYPAALLAAPGLIVGAAVSNFHDPNPWAMGSTNVLFYAYIGFSLCKGRWPHA